MEGHLKTVKQECIEALANKEKTYGLQQKGFNAKFNELQTEIDTLKKQIENEREEHEEVVKEIKEIN